MTSGHTPSIALLVALGLGCAGSSGGGKDAGTDPMAPVDAAHETDAFAPLEEAQYLVFTSDRPGLFEADGPERAHAHLDGVATALIDRIGTTGDGVTRQLGILILVPPWLLERALPGKLEMVVEQAFRVARERGIAVHFSIETHYFWDTRPDLWNAHDPAGPGFDPDNAENVEWTNWDGTLYVPHRYIDWGEPRRLAPHMCYAAPRVRAEVARLAAWVVAAVADELATMSPEEQRRWFSGVTVGSEPSLDDYTDVALFAPALADFMDADGAPRVRLGYCALTHAGYSAASPPADLHAAAAEINRQFIQDWASSLAAAGVPASRLYTHVAAGAHGTPVERFTNAPIDVAFIADARPGWTTYPWGGLAAGFDPIYDALAAHGQPRWASTEASPWDGRINRDMDAYLQAHFDHGAAVVVLNTGADGALAGKLFESIYGPAAIDAYRRFLIPAR
jgi:hypothetical protein